MGNYMLVYVAGDPSESDQLGATIEWIASLGAAVVDVGNFFGRPASTISSDGNVTNGGSSSLSGYSIISAATLSEACDTAKGCPLLSSGGSSIEVYEAIPITFPPIPDAETT